MSTKGYLDRLYKINNLTVTRETIYIRSNLFDIVREYEKYNKTIYGESICEVIGIKCEECNSRVVISQAIFNPPNRNCGCEFFNKLLLRISKE